MHRLIAYSVIVVLFTLIGCSDRKESFGGAKDARQTNVVTYASLKANDCIVKVGNCVLLRETVDRYIRLRFSLQKIINREIPAQARGSAENRLARHYVSMFKSKAMFLMAAKEQGVSTRDEDLTWQKSSVLANWCAGKIKDYDRLLSRLPKDEASLLQEEVASGALIRSYWFWRAGDRLKITESDISEVVKTGEKLQRESARLEVEQMTKAKTAYNRILSGEDFDKVRNELSENKEQDDEDGVWGTFLLHEIPYPELIPACATLASGGITEPIRIEDGIVIVRMISRSTDKESDGGMSAGSDVAETLTLAWIFFRRPMEYRIGSKEEIVDGITTERLTLLQREWIDSFKKKYIIHYPNGRIDFREKR